MLFFQIPRIGFPPSLAPPLSLFLFQVLGVVVVDSVVVVLVQCIKWCLFIGCGLFIRGFCIDYSALWYLMSYVMCVLLLIVMLILMHPTCCLLTYFK